MGHLSPLDGIGPAELGLDEFEGLLAEGEVREVILATNPTVEGEATAHYLGELALRRGLKASHIAHGVPVGGELEYVDVAPSGPRLPDAPAFPRRASRTAGTGGVALVAACRNLVREHGIAYCALRLRDGGNC